jgi:phosphoribosylformylglycinamidine cyclo-ligase
MFATFNMGLGFMAVVAADAAQRTLDALARRSIQAWEVGAIVAGSPGSEARALLRT